MATAVRRRIQFQLQSTQGVGVINAGSKGKECAPDSERICRLSAPLKNIRLQVSAKKSENIFRGGFALISGFLLQKRHKTLF
jgi:hypothetical protein